MPNAVEIWCWCLGISALALIGLFFGFYGVECALIGWALSHMDIGDLNQIYLRDTAVTAATETKDAERSSPEKIAVRVALPDADGTVVPFPVKRDRRGVRPRRKRRASEALARKEELDG